MDEKKAQNGKPNGGLSVKHAFIVSIVSVVLGSTSGPLLLDRVLGINPYRTDPFTGAEGRVFLQRIETLEGHVQNHPDAALREAIIKLTADAAAAKAEREQIMRLQERILDRLDATSPVRRN